MKKETIVSNTMREFKEGKLRSSSGDKVTDRDQAIAIALSKSGQSKYAKGGYIVQYDADKKKAGMRSKKEADDFVKVLQENGHTMIEVFQMHAKGNPIVPTTKSSEKQSATGENDIEDAIKGAKALLKFSSASEKKEIETFIKGLEILKKMSEKSSEKEAPKVSKSPRLPKLPKFKGEKIEYEPGLMISKPFYSPSRPYSMPAYRIENKWRPEETSTFVISESLNMSKEDAKVKSDAFYDAVKFAKTEEEFKELGRAWTAKWDLEKYKKMMSEKSASKKSPKVSSTPKERDYVSEAAEYFIDNEFIDELNQDEAYYVKELISNRKNKQRSQLEQEAIQYFIDNEMIDQLTTDKKFYIQKLLDNALTKAEPKSEKAYYHLGEMISEPFYFKDAAGSFSTEGYKIENKWDPYISASFIISNWLNISKADAKAKADAFYNAMKSAKTWDQYEKMSEKWIKDWNEKKEAEKSQSSATSIDKPKKVTKELKSSPKSITKSYTQTDVINFIKENSYFTDETEGDEITFVTRENGDVGNETPGAKDIQEAKRLKELIIKKFPDSKVNIENVDEWIYLYVDLSKSNEVSKKESNKEIDYKKLIAEKLSVSDEKAEKIISSLEYAKKYYEQNKNSDPTRYNNAFRVYAKYGIRYKDSSQGNIKFNSAKEVFDYIQSTEFVDNFFTSANPRNEIAVGLFGWDAGHFKLNKNGFPFKPNEETDYSASRTITLSAYPFAMVNINDSKDFIEKFKKIISDFIISYKIYVLKETKFEEGGVIGQEIVFDDNGEENKGVIKDIHEITGNYIVSTDDGRTVLADKQMDVLSLGKIREIPSERKKRFGFFKDGGTTSSESILWGVKVGDPYWKEVLITNNPDKIDAARQWALANGYDRLRVSSIDMSTNPDFTKTFKEGGSIGNDNFYVKSNFGHWSVMDRKTNKMIVGYSKKEDAVITTNELNKISDSSELSRTIAHLQTLKGYGHFLNKYSEGGSVQSNSRIGEKYLYVPYQNSPYTITNKLKMGQKWILTNDKNPSERHLLNDFEIEQWIKSGKLKRTNEEFKDGGVMQYDWASMWKKPSKSNTVMIGDIVFQKHSDQPYRIVELLDDEYTVAKIVNNQEIEWKTFNKDFYEHRMFEKRN